MNFSFNLIVADPFLTPTIKVKKILHILEVARMIDEDPLMWAIIWINHNQLFSKAVDNVLSYVKVAERQTECHEDAETMIVFYASHFSSPGKRIVVWCDDADDMELLLHHQVHISGMICMDMGLSSKNYRKIIDIKKLPEALSCN